MATIQRIPTEEGLKKLKKVQRDTKECVILNRQLFLLNLVDNFLNIPTDNNIKIIITFMKEYFLQESLEFYIDTCDIKDGDTFTIVENPTNSVKNHPYILKGETLQIKKMNDGSFKFFLL